MLYNIRIFAIVRAVATIGGIVSCLEAVNWGKGVASFAPITSNSKGDGGNQATVIGFFGMCGAPVGVESICI